MKITLPVSLNPISRRKDKSVKLSFETRELDATETMTLMALEGDEMWMCLAPNEHEMVIPEEQAEVGEKTTSERLRNVLFVWYKKLIDENKYVGTFQSFKDEKYEKFIEMIKSKLD